MKITGHTPTRLTIKDSAGCIWMLGFFFLAVAGTFVIGLMGMFSNLDEITELEKLGAWFVSLSGLAAGVWIIYGHPGVYAVFDKSTNSLTINRKGFMKNITETYRLGEIENIILDETADSDGDPFYRIALIIKHDKRVHLFSTGLHHKETQQKNVELIRRFLQNNPDKVGIETNVRRG